MQTGSGISVADCIPFGRPNFYCKRLHESRLQACETRIVYQAFAEADQGPICDRRSVFNDTSIFILFPFSHEGPA